MEKTELHCNLALLIKEFSQLSSISINRIHQLRGMGESMSSLLVVCIDKNLYMCYNNYSRWQRIHLVDLTM